MVQLKEQCQYIKSLPVDGTGFLALAVWNKIHGIIRRLLQMAAKW